MKRSRFVFICLFVFVIVCACNTEGNYDRAAIREQVKSSRVRRLKASQILLEAEKVGKKVASADASDFLNLIRTYQAKADTVNLYEPQPDSVLNVMKDVYRYAAEAQISAPAGIQANTDKLFYYTTLLENDSSILVLTLPKKYIILNMEGS